MPLSPISRNVARDVLNSLDDLHLSYKRDLPVSSLRSDMYFLLQDLNLLLHLRCFPLGMPLC